jgi:hypothetical protein
MAIFNVSNQLLQIDTGATRTFVYNASLSPVSIYAGIGENQVLGQRYFGVANKTPTNPSGAPAVFMLVQYKSTGKPAPVAGPAPVFWTDETYTTVSGVESEGLLGLNSAAGYLMPNTTDIVGLTDAMLETAQVLIQVSGYLKGAYGPTAGTAGVGNFITPSAGNWTSTGTIVGTAAPARPLGIQATVIASGLCDVLVDCDLI